MPSVSGQQQRYMAAAFKRRAQGRPRSTDPKMSLGKLQDFVRKVPGAPERKFGSAPVSEGT